MSRIQTRAAPALPANRAQRRRAARKRRPNPARGLAIAILALGAGAMFGGAIGRDPEPLVSASETATPPPTAIIQVAEIIPSMPVEIIHHDPAPTPMSPALLADTVPLDEATQRIVYEMCGENDALFCTAMAIANRESRFTPDVVGDGGDSIGMMQINTYWQRDRIADLGITDLTDIGQNMAVALDYIDWLATRMEPDAPESTYGTHALFMAYNMGLAGAREAWGIGVLQTNYSTACSEYFQTYMEGLEVAG